MKTREQNRNNKRTEIERFYWFTERIQTHLAFGWLSERSAEKTSCPKNFLEIALTSYYNTIGQSNNAFSILGFFWRENEESMFFSFQPLADKTNNEHLPKPCFKDIRKSLYKCKAFLHICDNIKRVYALFKQLFFEIEVNIMSELLKPLLTKIRGGEYC